MSDIVARWFFLLQETMRLVDLFSLWHCRHGEMRCAKITRLFDVVILSMLIFPKSVDDEAANCGALHKMLAQGLAVPIERGSRHC